jgi:MFS family permease
VYLAQLVAQFPLAWLLLRLPIAKFVSVMVLGWGIVLSCMAAANNFGGLLATRFFLGAFEASVAPAFIAITQMWWRRREQTVRVSYWYAMNGFTNMFGSLITWGLGHIISHLHAYQIIFLFFGVITVRRQSTPYHVLSHCSPFANTLDAGRLLRRHVVLHARFSY